MERQHGYTSPDDDGADDALAEAEQIIDGAAEATTTQTTSTPTRRVRTTPSPQAEMKAAEHLADLQRLQAEYVNYRKRVDRDRAAMGDVATSQGASRPCFRCSTTSPPRAHTATSPRGPFASIADKLEEALGRFGWSSFGAVGETFDPALHEALMSQPSADVTEPTVAAGRPAGPPRRRPRRAPRARHRRPARRRLGRTRRLQERRRP